MTTLLTPTVSLPGQDPTGADTSETSPTDTSTTTTTGTTTTTSSASATTAPTDPPASSSTTTSPSSTSDTTPSSTSTTSTTDVPPSSTDQSSTQPSSTSDGSPQTTPPPTDAGSATSAPLTGSSTFTSATVVIRTNSDGQVETLTSTQVFTAVPSGTSSSAVATHTSTPFFQNKAAVAGTFSAVAVVALVFIAFLATAAIRKRRARKFDDEVEEAAAEAAKATDRAYMDDEDDFRGGASLHTGYSDATHGTYAQAPMGVESYGMREMQHGGYPGYGEDGYVTSGVVAGAMQRSKSTRDGGAQLGQPYAAFAGPQYDPTTPYHDYTSGSGDPYAPANAYHQEAIAPNRQADLLDAAGLGEASMASNPARRSAADAAQQRGVSLSRSPSQVPTINHGGGLHRNKSITLEQGFFDPTAPPMPDPTPAPALPGLARTKSNTNPAATPKESYADRYAPEASAVPIARNPSSQSGGNVTARSGSGVTTSRPSSMLDPYGGVAVPETQRESYAEAYAPDGDARRSRVMSYDSDSDEDDLAPPKHRPEHDSQLSFRDDEDYGYNGGARVLRVANE